MNEMFYLTTHSTHFIYGYMASDMVKDHSDSKRGNQLLPHGLLFLIISKGSFICYLMFLYDNLWCFNYVFRLDPLSYFSFQPVLHDWCNKGRGTCYPVCGMMHIKEPLLLIGKSSPCGGSRFPLAI